MGDVTTAGLTLQTDRLLLRQWEDRDLDGLASMYADTEVMRYLGDGQLRTREQTHDAIVAMRRHWEEHGFGLWAAVLKESGQFIGRIGLAVPTFLPEVMPSVEVGWVLDRSVWGRGLATEGGRATLAYAFEALRLDRVISITHAENLASERIMRKLGMECWRKTIHPRYGVPLTVYRIPRAQWMPS